MAKKYDSEKWTGQIGGVPHQPTGFEKLIRDAQRHQERDIHRRGNPELKPIVFIIGLALGGGFLFAGYVLKFFIDFSRHSGTFPPETPIFYLVLIGFTLLVGSVFGGIRYLLDFIGWLPVTWLHLNSSIGIAIILLLIIASVAITLFIRNY